MSSDHYEWSASTSNQKLLFSFPTRVNLTTITLHYYSDSNRGLLRLWFVAVPDDFGVWDAPAGAHKYVEVAAVSHSGELAGHRNVSIEVNFNTKKVLLFKFRSALSFAVSEVEFSICRTSKPPLQFAESTIDYIILNFCSIHYKNYKYNCHYYWKCN